MAWLHLMVAGVLEVGWATTLKYSEGWTRIGFSLLTLALMGASFLFLSQALKHIPLGTAYAIWTGIGAVGTVLVGLLLFGEPATVGRLTWMAVIVTGIIGLRFAS